MRIRMRSKCVSFAAFPAGETLRFDKGSWPPCPFPQADSTWHHFDKVLTRPKGKCRRRKAESDGFRGEPNDV